MNVKLEEGDSRVRNLVKAFEHLRNEDKKQIVRSSCKQTGTLAKYTLHLQLLRMREHQRYLRRCARAADTDLHKNPAPVEKKNRDWGFNGIITWIVSLVWALVLALFHKPGGDQRRCSATTLATNEHHRAMPASSTRHRAFSKLGGVIYGGEDRPGSLAYGRQGHGRCGVRYSVDARVRTAHHEQDDSQRE